MADRRGPQKFLSLVSFVAGSITIGLNLVVLPVGDAAAADRDLSAKYAMSGTSLRPNSRSYEGECTLALSGEVYNVTCVNSGSGDKYFGKGIRRGDQFSSYLGEYLIVYRIGDNGTLTGNWAHSRSDDYGKETLERK